MLIRTGIDFHQTLKLKDESRMRFSAYSKMYIMTTENLDGYYRNFDFKDKEVLTVVSSFDHALNAVLFGAKKVTTFDINKLSYYMANLKLGAIKALTYNEFVEYFLSDHAFNYETYQKIIPYLKKNISRYFNKIYKYFKYNGKAIKDSFLFHHGHKNNLTDNTYLLNNNYDILKKKVQSFKVEFVNSSILDLSKRLKKEKYDLILLSNISDYAKSFFQDNYLEKYFNFVKNDITKLLKENGVIEAAYIYDYGNDLEVRSDINIESKRQKVLTDNFEIITFKSTIEYLENDAIIIRKGGSNHGK